MTGREFTAFALAGEIDLNRLAGQLGIHRRYRWEEPLLLNPDTLTPITTEQGQGRQVYLYYFGGVVFIDCPDQVMADFAHRIGNTVEAFKTFSAGRYRETYSLRVEARREPVVANNYAIVPVYAPIFSDLIAFVIAKSVALERIEENVDTVLDEVEGLIALLDKGKVGIPDRRLAKLASTILNFKYRSISHVMILDKPDITWEDPASERLYLTMANQFELSQRYQEIKHKSDTLLDITEVFSSLSHARRAARLEWIIIILIFIEIVIYVFDIVRKGG